MNLKVGVAKGLVLLSLVYAGGAVAEDFRDQQDRMNNEYYQRIDSQREMNRQRDHYELRQTQDNQHLKYQEQNRELKKAKKRVEHPSSTIQPKNLNPEKNYKIEEYKLEEIHRLLDE
jgi:membrane protein involved in colicin uptake